MREIIIQAMAQALSNNIGQVLTHELATGIATVVSQAAMQPEKAQETDGQGAGELCPCPAAESGS